MKVAFQAIYELFYETTRLIAKDNNQVRQRMWLLWDISRSEIQTNAFVPLLCGYRTRSNILTMVNCETYLSKHLITVYALSQEMRWAESSFGTCYIFFYFWWGILIFL